MPVKKGRVTREDFMFTLTELAVMTGIHRQTIAKRLKDEQPEPGSSAKRKKYFGGNVLPVIYRNNESHC